MFGPLPYKSARRVALGSLNLQRSYPDVGGATRSQEATQMMMDRYGPVPMMLFVAAAIVAFAWLNSMFWQMVF